jgi:hypothetical protein
MLSTANFDGGATLTVMVVPLPVRASADGLTAARNQSLAAVAEPPRPERVVILVVSTSTKVTRCLGGKPVAVATSMRVRSQSWRILTLPMPGIVD